MKLKVLFGVVLFLCLGAIVFVYKDSLFHTELTPTEKSTFLEFISGAYVVKNHHLDLRKNVTYDQISRFCEGIKDTHYIYNIWSIDASENTLTKFPSLECLGNLKELNLSYNSFTRIPQLGKIPSLSVLNLNKNMIGGITAISSLFPALTHLSIAYNKLSIIDFSFLPKSLSECEFQHNDLMDIKNGKLPISLVSLKLEYNKLNDSAIEDILTLKKLSFLTLSDNLINQVTVLKWNEISRNAKK